MFMDLDVVYHVRKGSGLALGGLGFRVWVLLEGGGLRVRCLG